MLIAMMCVSCYSSRKSDNNLRGLMLQENTKLPINKAFYSRHNVKARKSVHKGYRKYSARKY